MKWDEMQDTSEMLLAMVLLYALPFVHSKLCRLKAPASASEGVWPGTNIILNCTLLNGPVERISWGKDGQFLKNVNVVSPHKVTSPGGKPLLKWEGLKLDNITDRDDGKYSCLVNKSGKSYEDWLRIHIFAKPIITSPERSIIYLQHGETFVSTCAARGWPKPTVFWRKTGSDRELKNVFATKSYGVVLLIEFARDEDNGTYWCYANNTIGTALKAVLLHVDKPKRGKVVNMTTSYDHVIAYVSQRVTLRCKGVNVLEKYTTIIWERNGSRLEVSNDSYRFPNRKEVVFWYTLRSVTVEDAGNYTCVLVTDRGKIERSIKLCVKKNGPPLVSTKTPSIYINLGWPVTLTCTFRYVDTARAQLHWFKSNNKAVTYELRHKVQAITNNDGTVEYSLIIDNITRHDFGCYGCHVNTSYGWNSTTVCLHPPDSSTDLFSKMMSYSPSLTTPSWHTTISVFLVCIVVSMAGFVVGLLVRRSKTKNTGYWVSRNQENCEEYQYDVFITFSSKDLHWVQSELIPLIEKHNLNYCIHHRDFEPGKTIVDNMADSVYKSRHILAVLSKNYMSSTFCRGELDMAIGRNTQMKDSSLIAIRVDEIEKKRLPKALRSQMFLDLFEHAEKDVWESQLTKELVKDVRE